MRGFVSIIFVILLHLTFFAQEKIKPFVIGESVEFRSSVLGEQRTINVYLPEGYNYNDSIHYPVIYLFDGSSDEDFVHIAGLVQFGSFEWVNLCPKSIVIGIGNIDRKKDFCFPTTVKEDQDKFPTAGHSENFIRFIEKELKPFVTAHYKVSSQTTIIGQSLGGLLVTEILIQSPQLFDNYVIVSPSIWWDNESILNKKWANTNYPTKHVFLCVGGKEEKAMISGAQKLQTLLLTNKVKHAFKIMPDEDHGTILHLAVYKAFEELFKRKQL